MFDEALLRYLIALLVLIVGIIFLFGLFRFGIAIFSSQSTTLLTELRDILAHFASDTRHYQWWIDGLANWRQIYLEKRNDFWERYSQVALAVLIVVVLAVLLLAKVISAEAGLPILSAVAGFAIAKTPNSASSARRSEPPRNEGDRFVGV